jgi:cyclin T
LIGERLVLTTIRFDFNIQHPYRPLFDAMRNLGINQKEVKQVAWNFVNDWLKTTLCLQYKPQYIAAGSLYLAAKLHNIKLPLHGAHVWWHQFDVAPKPLEGMWSTKWNAPSLHSVPFGT